jgi:hypothetical protein
MQQSRSLKSITHPRDRSAIEYRICSTMPPLSAFSCLPGLCHTQGRRLHTRMREKSQPRARACSLHHSKLPPFIIWGVYLLVVYTKCQMSNNNVSRINRSVNTVFLIWTGWLVPQHVCHGSTSAYGERVHSRIEKFYKAFPHKKMLKRQ